MPTNYYYTTKRYKNIKHIQHNTHNKVTGEQNVQNSEKKLIQQTIRERAREREREREQNNLKIKLKDSCHTYKH